MEAAGWSGGAYGIRIKVDDRERHFPRDLPTIWVHAGDDSGEINLSPSFWRHCPELRGGVVQRWLLREGLAPWPYRKPPKVELLRLTKRDFRLRTKGETSA